MDAVAQLQDIKQPPLAEDDLRRLGGIRTLRPRWKPFRKSSNPLLTRFFCMVGLYSLLTGICDWTGFFEIPPKQSTGTQTPAVFWQPRIAGTTINESLSNSAAIQVTDKRVGKDKPTWENKYGIVHVIHTRFMQHQANLTHLGKARLELFRTITVPSIQHQSTQEFVWIVRTDPDLVQSLLHELRHELLKLPNAVLVGSNQNQDEKRNGMKDVTEESVLAGSYDLVMSLHDAASTSPVLETRLDADDGLSTHFIASLQSEAALVVSQQHKEDRPFSWMVLCSFDSLEWQLYNPWDKRSRTGIVCFSTERTCVTPGLTIVYDANETGQDVPKLPHHKIAKLIPPCRKHGNNRCLQQIPFDGKTSVFRSRTPTSAGMKHVFSSSTDGPTKDSRQQLEFHNKTWSELHSRFGIHTNEIVNTRSKLLDDLLAVADDNLQGQCTKHHSCKQSSKEKLESIKAIGPTEI